MAENMGKWASGNRKIAKSGHRVAAEMVPFPQRWHGGMISANKEAVWGMSVRWFVRNALGRVHPAERHFLPEDELPRVYREARIILLIYAAVGLIAFYFGSWAPITLWFIPRVIGEPFRRWVTVPEHAARPQVLDLHVNTRTILTPKWFSWLLWNMNFHAEHHISPSVPYHALPDLHRVIRAKVPVEIGYWKVTSNILRQFSGKGAATTDRGSVLAGN